MLNLKEVRLKQGLTQLKLSELSGVPKRTIEHAESVNDCHFSTACKLAIALKVSLDELWNKEGE